MPVLLAFLITLGLSACTRGQSSESVNVACETEPDPPSVGVLEVDCRIIDPLGEPVSVSYVQLEANMTHPGMQPIIGEMQPDESGTYIGRIEITMAGDWYLLLTGDTESGDVFEHTIPLTGVR